MPWRMTLRPHFALPVLLGRMARGRLREIAVRLDVARRLSSCLGLVILLMRSDCQR